MKARKLTRRSPPTTVRRLQEYVEWVGEQGDSWEDDHGDVDVDAEVRFDHRPIDTEAFSVHTDGL